ncbi:conserved hypothetical protein [Nitrobacter hamburgensis X14]|uniref:Uncharacterized protein n=1 Tax=Nitrobacter hamburgensis (strain DSM 10229 / NCIMB 13809 / X14) TaxID=323097 RepID=Q1QPZ7_NITHX|nr:hypothetical protein [Nitrobacter hamburgensis]ABE61700.1 conserved hypothetical protein [Nitrobacter hamburgensis X14]
MTGFSRSPRILKAGLVLLDPVLFTVTRIITLQYNPDQLSRTMQILSAGGDSQDRTEALRLRGPAVEIFKLEAELDATDQLEFPAANKDAVELGIFPQMSLLESLISPSSDAIVGADALLRNGAIEIAPMEAPLTLFVWSAQRVVPVRVTEFSVTEEAFDTTLNPIHAKISLSLRVLSVNDLPVDHRGAEFFLAYLRTKESLARRAADGTRTQLGAQGF